MTLKEGDFINVEYTGKDKEGHTFDSTKGKAAKELRGKEGPILIIYGKGQLLKGLEEAIKDLEIGKEIKVTLPPEKAFGEKKKDLLHIMKPEEFHRYEINPQPGLSVHVDFDDGRLIGVIKSVSGGRVLVDFNHPLAGQELIYNIQITEILTNTEKKISALIEESGMKCKHAFKDGTLTLDIEKNSEDMKDEDFNQLKLILISSLKHLIPEIKEITEKSEKTKDIKEKSEKTKDIKEKSEKTKDIKEKSEKDIKEKTKDKEKK